MSELWTMSLIHDLALGLFFEFLCVADGLGSIICLPQSDKRIYTQTQPFDFSGRMDF